MTKASDLEESFLKDFFRKVFDVGKFTFAQQDYRFVGFVQGNITVATVEESISIKMLEMNAKGMASLYYRVKKALDAADIVETISENSIKVTIISL